MTLKPIKKQNKLTANEIEQQKRRRSKYKIIPSIYKQSIQRISGEREKTERKSVVVCVQESKWGKIGRVFEGGVFGF